MNAVSGQAATQVVELAAPVPKSYMMVTPEADPRGFAQGALQPTYFRDRKGLSKHVKTRLVLMVPAAQ